MSTEMDSAATRELAASVTALNRTVIRLETLMETFGPIQKQQVDGLADCTNRVTRLEDRYDALEKSIQAQSEQRKNEIVGNRWLIGITFTAVSLLLTIIVLIASHVVLK